jgi:hypothetical protein
MTFNLTEESAKAFQKFCENAFSKEQRDSISAEMIKIYNLMREMNTTKTYLQFKDGVKITCEIDLSEYHKDR